MPEFEEDPKMFKLEGFPVHEGTEYHNDALEDASVNKFSMGSMGGSGGGGGDYMGMINQVKDMFSSGDKKDGTPPPDELGAKGV